MTELRLRLLTGTEEERRELQAVFDAAPDYALRSTGQGPRSTAAEEMLRERPPGIGAEDKHCLGFYAGSSMVGCVDVIRGYPTSEFAFIGLLLVREEHRGRGVGRSLFEAVERYCEGWPGVERLRLAVLESNDPAFAFWEATGFQRTGEVLPYEDRGFRSQVVLMEKSLGSEQR